MNTINNLSNTFIRSGKQSDGKSDSVTADKTNNQTTNTADKVTLTGAGDLQQIEKNIASSSEVNMDKVSQIKQAMANGSYQIDADLVAKNFFDVEQALGKI